MGVRMSGITKKAKAKEKAKGKAKARNRRASKKAATTTTTTTTTTTLSSSTSSSTNAQPVDLAEVRKDISNLVGANATDLARAVMETGKTGQLAPVKYLFEVTGLYPAVESNDAKPDPEFLAHMLMRKMNLPVSPIVNEDDEDAPAKPAPANQATADAAPPAPPEHSGSADTGTGAEGKHADAEPDADAERSGGSIVE